MRKPDGYATVVGDFKSPFLLDGATGEHHHEAEIDTFSCGHCTRIVHVQPRQDAADVGGGCRICQRNICPRCVDLGFCQPFEEKLASMEARRSYGL